MANDNPLRILAFDVFGTVVDWHTSVARAVDAAELGIDGAEFARAWRAGYQPAMQRVRSGELGWTDIDTLHRMILDDLLVRYGRDDLSETARVELNDVWHRLDAWPEVPAALGRLKQRYMLCTLSNGNIDLLVDMARHADLPWDCVLSAETFHRYKPDPAPYLGIAKLFNVAPAAVMMVAAHQNDLDAARACGLQTAYIERAPEFGADAPKDVSPNPANTLHARDLADLADQLDCELS